MQPVRNIFYCTAVVLFIGEQWSQVFCLRDRHLRLLEDLSGERSMEGMW